MTRCLWAGRSSSHGLGPAGAAWETCARGAVVLAAAHGALQAWRSKIAGAHSAARSPWHEVGLALGHAANAKLGERVHLQRRRLLGLPLHLALHRRLVAADRDLPSVGALARDEIVRCLGTIEPRAAPLGQRRRLWLRLAALCRRRACGCSLQRGGAVSEAERG
eukprot:474931-Prymnesium_polylepis.1